jgi:glycosyltransferase involved in cell wall biosynthesis
VTSTAKAAEDLVVPSAPPETRAAAIEGISVVVPAYNEAEAIGPQIAAIGQAMAKVQLPWELVIVNDGSTDGTGDLARKAGARVIENPGNAGYGASLKRGILAARYEHVVICDADGTYPVDRIPDLVKEAERGFDMVVGARTGRYYRGSLLKHPWRLVYLELCRFVTGVKIPDANSGLRLFRKRLALDVFDDLCPGYSFTTTLTLASLSRRAFVKFMPIAYGARIGKSKVRFLIDALRTAQLVLQAIVLYNPVKLFLLLSAFPGVVSLVLFALSLWLWNATIGVGAVIAGCTAILVLSIGFLGELLRKVALKDVADPMTTRPGGH